MADDGIVQYPRGAWVIKQFGDGPARAWEADAEVPKLLDVVQCVVYLFGSMADARSDNLADPPLFREDPKTGIARAASGCLIEVFTPPSFHQYVVTNRHVVKEGASSRDSPSRTRVATMITP